MAKGPKIETARKLLEMARESYDLGEAIWERLNIGSPIATTVAFLYPKSQMRTTKIYRLPDRQRRWQRTKIKLPAGQNFRIESILDLDSGVDYSNAAVYREGNVAILDPTKFPSSSERFMIVTVNDTSPEFLRALVDLRVSEVPSREDEEQEKHWIVAAMRDETLLREFYEQAALEDVDVGVGIRLDRHYSTVLRTVDNPLIRLIRANQSIFKGIDRNNRSLESVGRKQRRRILQKEMKPKKGDLFSELARLCLPIMFKNYISIDNPNFSYINARRSENLMTLGNIIIPIPSGMNVTLYTTLKIDDPAQRGHVIFNRGTFCQDVEKVLRVHFRLRKARPDI